MLYLHILVAIISTVLALTQNESIDLTPNIITASYTMLPYYQNETPSPAPCSSVSYTPTITVNTSKSFNPYVNLIVDTFTSITKSASYSKTVTKSFTNSVSKAFLTKNQLQRI